MPIGLGIVRIGNFLNGELYGKATNGEWGFIFPTDPFGLLRHPSQLYESFGEGLVLFLFLFFISSKTNVKGIVSSFFLIFYGSIRFIIEFYRQPDSHMGYIAFDTLSMGQILCITYDYCRFHNIGIFKKSSMKAYLDLLKFILENGQEKEDRTNTGTISSFGHQLEFDSNDGFPAVTTKSLAWKGVVSELLWFLEGSMMKED